MSGKVCFVCCTETAETFCTCTPATFLCRQCCASHINQPGQTHTTLPIACFGKHTQAGFVDRLQARQTELPGRVAVLRQNLTAVEECIARFSEAVEGLIARIRREAEEIKQELRTLRQQFDRDIDAAVQETEATMYEDELPQIGPFGLLLRDTNIPLDLLDLFSYNIGTTLGLPLRQHFTFSLRSPTNLLSNFPLIAAIYSSKLELTDLTENTARSFVLPRSFSNGTSLCIIDTTRLLLIGGHNPPTKEVFWLNIEGEISISATAEMATAVGYSGIIRVYNWVYVFGGYNHQTSICASTKYSLKSTIWNPLFPMSIPKAGFSPCFFHPNIYLIEICQYQGAEKFHIQSETYTALHVALPSTVYASSYNVLIGREMLFLSSDMKIRKWNVETGTVSTAVFGGRCPGEGLCSNCPPVCWGNKVYFVQVDTGKICTYSLISSTLDSH